MSTCRRHNLHTVKVARCAPTMDDSSDDDDFFMMMSAAGAAAAYLSMLQVLLFLTSQEKERRRETEVFGLHLGPGVFDDYEFLFDQQRRSVYSESELHAYEAQFKSIFRLDVKSYGYVSRKLKRKLRRTGGRGNQGVHHKYIMAAAVLHLATGDTYASVARQVRNGISVATVERAVRAFTRAVVKHLEGE